MQRHVVLQGIRAGQILADYEETLHAKADRHDDIRTYARSADRYLQQTTELLTLSAQKSDATWFLGPTGGCATVHARPCSEWLGSAP